MRLSSGRSLPVPEHAGRRPQEKGSQDALGNKILPSDELARKLSAHRKDGKRIVFTNGCFDLLHVGHVRYLQAAKKLGNLLVVAINSDRSVRALKGESRPIQAEQDRLEILAALECVDYVTLFEEETPQRIIELLQPDILVKGGDWPREKIVGREEVESRGGKVVTIPYVVGASTTGLIQKIFRSSSQA